MASKVSSESLTITDFQQGLKMAEKVGPFHTEVNLMEWLGSTREEIRSRVESRELLAVQDAEGDFYYPERQFLDNGSVVLGLHEVLKTLESGTPVAWTWALWLATKSDAFNNRTALETLRDGDIDAVLRVAERDASRWAE